MQSASAFYATGSITGNEIGGPLYPRSTAIADPFAHFAPVQNAFARLSPGAGSAVNNGSNTTLVLSPGTYSSWSISGTVTLTPGIYYVNGTINVGSQAQISGTGVTIIASGPLSVTGQGQITLSAAAFDATSGAIPGVAFADNSTSPSSMAGGSAATVTGAVYYPNGDLSFAGGSSLGKNCLEVVAKSISLTGNSSMSSAGCSGYGSPAFGSMPQALVALVK